MPTPPCTRPKTRAATGTRCSTRPCAVAQSYASPWRANCARPCPATSSRCTTNPSSSPPAGDRWAPRHWSGGITRRPALSRRSSSYPVAEDSGLIKPVGRWVFEQAVSQLAAWDARKRRPVPRFSRRQPVRPPARRPGDPGHGPRRARALPHRPGPDMCRGHRVRGHGGQRGHTTFIGRLQGPRAAGGHRRFRYRLLLAWPTCTLCPSLL